MQSSYHVSEYQSHTLASWKLHQLLQTAFPEGYKYFEKTNDRTRQRLGIDAILHCQNGDKIPVDLKVLNKDPVVEFGRLDIPLEITSCVERNTPGYLLHGGMDTRYIIWIFKPTGRVVRLPFRTLAATLKLNLTKWQKRYRLHQQTTKGYYENYHSEVMFVPLNVIQDAMEIYLHRYGATFARNAD